MAGQDGPPFAAVFSRREAMQVGIISVDVGEGPLQQQAVVESAA